MSLQGNETDNSFLVGNLHEQSHIEPFHQLFIILFFLKSHMSYFKRFCLFSNNYIYIKSPLVPFPIDLLMTSHEVKMKGIWCFIYSVESCHELTQTFILILFTTEKSLINVRFSQRTTSPCYCFMQWASSMAPSLSLASQHISSPCQGNWFRHRLLTPMEARAVIGIAGELCSKELTLLKKEVWPLSLAPER